MAERIVTFHRLALDDFRKGVRWYREQRTRAAARFGPAVLEAADRIAADAESFPVATLDVRWVPVKKYPYVLYFLILDDQHCRVISVAHTSRRPGFWLRRLNRP